MTSDSRLAAELHGAVERGEIGAVYQPQVDLRTGRIVAAEILSRWNHPEHGVISPGVYIPIAEDTSLIHSLGRHMIEQALTTAAQWHSHGIDLEVSVNVSATQLTALEFFDLLDADLERLDLPPHSVTIEITEAQPLLDTPSIRRRLDDLAARGVGVSIDDYGAGHSSLAQLDKVHATELKLDLALVQDESVASRALMTAVVELAHWQGLRVVAEGIETEDQLQRMRDLACDRGQGYLLGRPMPREALEALL